MAVSFVSSVLKYAPAALVLSVVYAITLGIYRVYFSPLSHIPGPRLAAATRWYELYHDAYKVGKYYLEIEKMHKRYGNLRRCSLISRVNELTRELRAYRPHHPIRSAHLGSGLL